MKIYWGKEKPVSIDYLYKSETWSIQIGHCLIHIFSETRSNGKLCLCERLPVLRNCLPGKTNSPISKGDYFGSLVWKKSNLLACKSSAHPVHFAQYMVAPISWAIKLAHKSTCCNSRSTLQWILQQIVIEPCFSFSYSSNMIKESLCNVRKYINWRKVQGKRGKTNQNTSIYLDI